MLAQVFNTLDSWLGRQFLFARYFPWLLFVAANIALAATEFPAVREFVISEYQDVSTSEKLIDIFALLFCTAVIAFVLSPVTPVITKMLEGPNLPSWLAEPLVLRHVIERDNVLKKRSGFFAALVELPEKNGIKPILQKIEKNRLRGEVLMSLVDEDAIDEAEAKMRSLRRLRLVNRPVTNVDLQEAIEALELALRTNCADEKLLRRPSQVPKAKQLAALHEEFARTMLPYAISLSEGREARAYDKYAEQYSDVEVMPTRFGNDVAALRAYCSSRYGFDFDVLWPRLSMVIKDQQLVSRLESSKTQVDFSILCMTLTSLFTVVWLVVLAIYGKSLLTVAIVTLGAPVVFVAWFGIVHQSYQAYAVVVRLAIDVARFDLLDALRQPLPLTTADEKASWIRAAEFLGRNYRDEFSYRHPP
ncbi:hypothetical protein [Rhizobium ruizarguesonis]|uniref:hypothetical protein n=1 Tax=Rhizobium ruizarguesonis TaxID=2081791 RepID=UPI00102FC365|nr:hypothetical protein [Rhizobium ruizarguesonis]TBC84237.1 hypothetical protein ELH28_16345 [Rhizobium ruizarguesonis]